jgi:hypothetical protein
MVVHHFFSLTLSIRWRLFFPTFYWSINTNMGLPLGIRYVSMTEMPLTLYPRRRSRGIPGFSPRCKHFVDVRSSMAPRSVRSTAFTEAKQNCSVICWRPIIYYLEFRASEGTLICWSRLQNSPIRTGPACWVIARSPYVRCALCLCPSSGDINKLMMIMLTFYQSALGTRISWRCGK